MSEAGTAGHGRVPRPPWQPRRLACNEAKDTCSPWGLWDRTSMSRRTRMGHVFADITFRVRNGQMAHRRLLVDTGSTYTWIPASFAESLVIERKERRPFGLATGDVVDRWIGEVEVEILGRRSTTIIVFGDEGIRGLIGVYTLEGLLLEVDPVHQLVRPQKAAFAYRSRLDAVSPSPAIDPVGTSRKGRGGPVGI